MLIELLLLEASFETCPFRAEDRELEALEELYLFCTLKYDVPWTALDPSLLQPCTRSFNSVRADRCSQDYAFRTVEQLKRVYELLNFPLLFKDPVTRSIYNSEQLFLFTLTRLSSVGATVTSLIENGFGHDDPYWTRGFKIMIIDINRRWGYKVKDNFAYWAPRFQEFAAANEKWANHYMTTVSPMHAAHVFLLGACRILGFVDCNNQASTRPGAGPAQPGAQTARGIY